MSRIGFSQHKPINYDNIFATSYTYVGVPIDDSLYIFGLENNMWITKYCFKIPVSTIAMDGNESHVFFLTKKEMIVQHFYNCGDMCEKDTLILDDIDGKIIPKNWLRNISSTEKDFTVFDNSALQYYSQDGEGWKVKMFSNPFEKTEKKDQKYYINMPYKKIMSFDNDMYMITMQDQYLKFWVLDIENMFEKVPQLKKESIPVEKLDLKLPKDALSFFVYDGRKLGWVYNDHIEFFDYTEEKQLWEKASIPDLKFDELMKNKTKL